MQNKNHAQPEVLLIGFGHFGQALLPELLRWGRSNFSSIGIYIRYTQLSAEQKKNRYEQLTSQLKSIVALVKQQLAPDTLVADPTVNDEYPDHSRLSQATLWHLCMRPADLGSFCSEHQQEVEQFTGTVISWLGSTTYSELRAVFPKARLIRAMSSILLKENTVATAYLGHEIDLTWWKNQIPISSLIHSLFYTTNQEDLFLYHVPLLGSLVALMANQIKMLAVQLNQHSYDHQDLLEKNHSPSVIQLLLTLFSSSINSIEKNCEHQDLDTLITEVATPGGLTEKMIAFHQGQIDQKKSDLWPLVPITELQ